MEITPIPSPARMIRYCQGKTKGNKQCKIIVEGDTLFCPHHKGQEEEWIQFNLIHHNPLFVDKSDTEIRTLGAKYGLTDGRLKIENLKKMILQEKPKFERFEVMKPKIMVLDVNPSELNSDLERELYDKVVKKKQRRLQRIREILDSIIHGELDLVESDDGDIIISGKKFKFGVRKGTKHQYVFPKDETYEEINETSDQKKFITKSLKESYFNDLEMEYEMLSSSNVILTEYNEIVREWENELNKNPSSRWNKIERKLDYITKQPSSYNFDYEYQQYIPELPYESRWHYDIHLRPEFPQVSYPPFGKDIDKSHYEQKLERFKRMNELRLNLSNYFTQDEERYLADQIFNKQDKSILKATRVYTREDRERELEKETSCHFCNHWYSSFEFQPFYNDYMTAHKTMKKKRMKPTYGRMKELFPRWIYCVEAFEEMEEYALGE